MLFWAHSNYSFLSLSQNLHIDMYWCIFFQIWYYEISLKYIVKLICFLSRIFSFILLVSITKVSYDFWIVFIFSTVCAIVTWNPTRIKKNHAKPNLFLILLITYHTFLCHTLVWYFYYYRKHAFGSFQYTCSIIKNDSSHESRIAFCTIKLVLWFFEVKCF